MNSSPIPQPAARRIEVDREDLMREATALRQRAEFRVPGENETVVVGYRSNSSLSIYFGPDPVFQFDRDGRLRRAFVDGNLFRTQGDTLARLQRVRSSASVELQRHDLSTSECHAFLERSRLRLSRFLEALKSGTADCLSGVLWDTTTSEKLLHDLSRWLAAPLSLAPPIAARK
ncbi:MAG: hypothetical protein KF861_19200 [Planctomycetaceae bacterium]|nr:hypothetical protein [Planctomycetaceae bacterium]